MNLKWISIGLMLAFIFTTCSPAVLPTDTEIVNREFMDDFAFDCYDEYHSSKVSYYRERLLKNYSNDGDVEEYVMPVEILAMVRLECPMDSPWPMKCNDVKHTGRSSYSTANNNGVELWKFKTDRWIESGPVIGSDGDIYFGCFDSYLYALFPNGSLKWKFDTGGWIWSTPAIAKDGTIYIGSYDGFLYAINNDGSSKWKISIGTISSSPVIGEDGTIYIGTMGNRIYAINPNGTVKWYYDTDYKIVSDPAIADDGTIYIGSGDTYLYAMNPDGTLRWRFKTGDWIKAHPSIAEDGTIYISSFDHYLYALYPDGTMKWRYGSYGGCSSASIDKDGIIYVAGKNKLMAIYPNGTNKWSFDLGNEHIGHASSAISADGTIYIGTKIYNSVGGNIIAINPDGTEKWRERIANNWVESSPCIGEDGTVYIGSSSDNAGYSYGYLYAFGHGSNNHPPDKPDITGPLTGRIQEEQDYTFSVNDADSDDIYLFVDWGDNTNSGWLGHYASGEEVTLKHTWNQKGTYTMKAKGMDEHNVEGDWSTQHVSMSKNRIINPFERFLENHPYMFPFAEILFTRAVNLIYRYEPVILWRGK